MKKLTMYLIITATLFTVLSFVPAVNSNKEKSTNTGDSKYYYFRVSTLKNGYYFSNVIEVEDNGSGTFKSMMKSKETFKATLKSDYDLTWPLSNITHYEFYSSGSAEKDRKNRISQAGDDIKYIDL